MSRNTHAPRHRATPVRSGTVEMVSKAVSSNAGRLGPPAAALAAASALTLGIGAPAQASATGNDSAAANTSGTASSYTANTGSAAAGSSSYTVQSGDTLGQIAAQHGLSLNDVLSLNGLSVDTIIYPGDVIALPGSGNSSGSSTTLNAPQTEPVEPAAAGAGAANTPANSGVSLAGSGYTEIPSSSTNTAILASAKAQLAAGAVQDCTVLGEKALRAAGISGVGDESPESLMAFATPVSNPQPGDFIYYADGGMGFSHNAVYIGDGKAIHSGWNGNQTVVKSVDVGSGPVYYRVNG